MTTPRKRRIKVLRRLKLLECSLVDNPANPHARILLYKRADPDDQRDHHDDHREDEPMPEPTYSRADVAEAMLAHAAAMYPADTPEQSLAAAVRDNDPLLHRLYKRHSELPPEVVKSGGIGVEQSPETDFRQGEEMDAAWADIEAAADQLWDKFPTMTREQIIAKTLERHPSLAAVYNDAQRQASWELNQRVGTRREL